MTLLQVKNLCKTYHYDDCAVLVDINFSVNKGSITTLLMGSDGGKTTLAKILVGLEKPSSGEIIFNGLPLLDTPPQYRNFAFISCPSLFDKGKVKDNVAYGLRVRGVDKKNATEKAKQMLAYYGMEDLADKKVKTLTLTQRAKLDFARAFCRQVTLLILDGCFGKCAETDEFLRQEISVRQKEGVAVLLLTDEKKYALGDTYDFLPIFEKEN